MYLLATKKNTKVGDKLKFGPSEETSWDVEHFVVVKITNNRVELKNLTTGIMRCVTPSEFESSNYKHETDDYDVINVKER